MDLKSGDLIILDPPESIDVDDFDKQTDEEKMGTVLSTLNLICAKVQQFDIQVNHEDVGLHPRMQTIQEQSDTVATDVAELKWENNILKGIVQKQSKQIQTLTDRVTQLTVKSMEKNLIVTGILGDEKKESCKAKALEFFKNQVEIDCSLEEIMVAHRKGTFVEGQNRPMIIRCTYDLCDRALKNAKNLKDKENEQGEKYYVNRQIPDVVAEQERENRQLIREQKLKDSSLPSRDKSKIEVKNRQVYIDGAAVEQKLLPPQPIELFVDKAERDKMEKIKFAVSDTTSMTGSEFIGFAFKTGQFAEVKRAYRKVKSLHPSADHIIGAYNLKNNWGFQDDSELGAGR